MSNVVALKNVNERPAPAPASEYLGPAEVVEVGPGEITVRLPDGAAATARMALAFPYQPRVEDVVLVIGRGEAHYVIGVLHGGGETTLAFQGDVSVRAVGGKLDLSGDEGVQVSGREVLVSAGSFKLVADTMVQKVASAYHRIAGLLSVRAGESQTVVDGASVARSKSGTILTEDKMSINGKHIYLG